MLKYKLINWKYLINKITTYESELLSNQRIKQILENKETIKNTSHYVDIFAIDELKTKHRESFDKYI